MNGVILLDGPMGTELHARGIATPLPAWSSLALETAPDVVRAIHREYAAAGATVHTTNTFRTRPAVLGEGWAESARLAVRLAREAVPRDHRVAGSIAPLEDCYSPQDSPADRDPDGTRSAHAGLARVLADAGCDLLLCETFPHVEEAWLATEAAVATGLETWTSFTPGPSTDLLTPAEVGWAAAGACDRGARAVLVNCLAHHRVPDYLDALTKAAAGREVLVGVYANAGWVDGESGWKPAPLAPDEYAGSALAWRDAGATILGTCCGTGVEHVAALARAFAR